MSRSLLLGWVGNSNLTQSPWLENCPPRKWRGTSDFPSAYGPQGIWSDPSMRSQGSLQQSTKERWLLPRGGWRRKRSLHPCLWLTSRDALDQASLIPSQWRGMDCALFGSEYEPPDPGPLHPESPEREREAVQRRLTLTIKGWGGEWGACEKEPNLGGGSLFKPQ